MVVVGEFSRSFWWYFCICAVPEHIFDTSTFDLTRSIYPVNKVAKMGLDVEPLGKTDVVPLGETDVEPLRKTDVELLGETDVDKSLGKTFVDPLRN